MSPRPDRHLVTSSTPVCAMQLNAVARSVQQSEQAAALQQMAARNERLQSELDAKAAAASSCQHSLYTVRAHWGGLRKVLAQVHALAREGPSGASSFEQVRGPGTKACAFLPLCSEA